MGKGKPDAAVAFSAIASPLVDSAVEQARHIAREPAAEGIHQLRVALRNLLTLWWLYRPLIGAEEYARQRGCLKSIASAAGKARDYDILIELLSRHGKCSAAGIAAIYVAREAALQAGREILSPPHIQTCLLKTLAQTEAGLRAKPRQLRLGALAEARIAKSRRQLHQRIKRAITANKPDIEAFHDVRKAGKKTRYLLELFGSLLPKDHHRLLKRLKKIQQPLGELNDLAASESLLRQNLRLISTPDQAKKLERWLKRKRKRRQSTLACTLRQDWQSKRPG